MKVKLRSLRSLLPSKKIGRKNKKKSPPAEHEAPASNDLLGEDESSSGDTAPTEPPSPDRAKYEASSDDNSADQPQVNTIEGEAGIELKMDEEEKKNTGKEVDNDAAAFRIKTLLQNAYGEEFFSGNELESKSQVLLERYAGREALLLAALEHKSKDRKEAQTDADASEDERSELTETSGASISMFSEDSQAGSCTDVDEEDVYDNQTLNTEDEDNGYDAVFYAIEEHPVVARLDKMVGKTTACDPFPAIDCIDDATVDAAAGCSPMGCIDE